jgi:NAD+ synthase
MIKLNNLENFITVSVTEMKDYFKRCNLHAAVLGISGGVDSTLVAVLMHKVSQELNSEGYSFTFYGVSLPTKTTYSKEFWAAQLVGNAFCDNFEVNNEMEEASSVVVDWLGNWSNKIEPLRSGNAKSRLRMIYLYDFAKKVNGIVMGTDNYTEYLLGFSTIGGDALFDYNPMQELWKSEVFEICKILQEQYAGLKDYPKAAAIMTSLALKPMDGLGISSDDMVQIGARHYYDVDDILQWYLENQDRPGYPEYITSSLDGYKIPAKTMELIIKRHKGSEFKRNHPVIISRGRYSYK